MSALRWWPRLALLAILALAAVLRLLWLDREGWANQYYAATVQSMLTGWKAFFFACYDPECFVTVDKSPLGFWVQAAFANVLGMHGVALILPQALAGVASVGLLYLLVRRAFGALAGLLAALALAVMPISVATDRNNTIDAQLVLVTLLAGYSAVRAVETGRLRWLVLSFALVGLGFEIKMLQAYLVVPSLVLLYLVAARAGVARRLAHLGAATAVMLVTSLAWPLAVDLTPPAERPYVGGSRDNSVLELITGHNGVARLGALGRGLLGRAPQPPAPADGPPPPGPFPGNVVAIGGAAGGESGEPGPLRLLTVQLAGQISWLLPLALIGAVAIATRAAWRPRPDRRAVLLVLFGAWLLTMGAFFSVTSGIFHRYYLVMLAPAIAALAGAGAVELWREYADRRRALAAGLPLALAMTAGLQVVILGPFGEWDARLSPIAAGAALAALVVAAAALPVPRAAQGARRAALSRVTRAAAPAAFVTALVAIVVAPVTWAAMPVVNAPGAGLPAAGPDAGPGPRGFGSVPPRGNVGPPGLPFPAVGPGPDRSDPRIASHLLSQRGDSRWIVAVRSAASASSLMLDTKAPVMALGGFGGGDRILAGAAFRDLVRRGDVRFVLLDGAGPGGALIAPGPAAPQQGRPGGPATPVVRGPADDEITVWVRATCAQVSGLPGLWDCAPR